MKRFIAKVSKSFKGGQKGFTLIELLIVIVILGVLAAAIIPNLSKFVGSGNVGAANAELASVKTAVSAYQADNNGVLPTGLTVAGPVVGGANVVVNSVLIDPATGYVTGTIKGYYRVDASGKVTAVSNGLDAATGWPLTIDFDTNVNVLRWINGTGAYGAP